MKTHMLLKRLHALRIAFFALAMIVTSVLVPLSGLTSSTANALTALECYNKFNNKEITYSELSSQDQAAFNECKSKGCSDVGAGQDIGSRRISCVNPSSIPGGVTQAAADAEVKPLQTLVCGPIPASEQNYPTYLECADNVRNIYNSCNSTGGGVTGSGQDTDENTAKCVYNKLPSPRPTLANVKTKVTEGRLAAQGIIDTEIGRQQEEEKKKACEADGGTWENSKCTAAAEDKPTCNIDSVGWLVCPTVNFLSSIVDGSYAAVSSLLTIQPLVTNNPNNDIYKAWSVMRNFSNVAFAVAFLIIIFSQVTSVGVSNYGIKKLLPKLIIAAVLVNVSYWLCAILVDLSNIVGGSINDLFKGVTDRITPKLPASATGGIENPLGFAGIAATLLVATGVLLYVGLSALIPALILGVMAIVTVFLVLVVRQALIILLIVVSPLAFVAFLLPNTESLFNKWKGLFQTLLIMYPVIGLIFGASGLASSVVMNGATGPYKIVTQIAGAAIAILPPAAILLFLKSLSGVLGRVGAWVNNPKRGPFDRMRKGGEAFRNYRQNVNRTNRRRRARGQGGVGEFASSIGSEGSRTRRAAMWLAGSGVTAGMNQKRKYSSAEAVDKSDEQSYVANRALADQAYAEHITAPTGSVDLTKAYSIEAVAQEWKKDVAAAKAIFEHEGTPFQDLAAQIQNGSLDGDPARKNAALQRFFELSNSDGVQDMIEHLGQLRTNNPNGDSLENIQQLQKTAAESLAGSPMKPVDLSGSNLSRMKTGEFTATEAARVAETISEGKTTAQHIAKMDVDEMRRWNAQLNDPALLQGVDHDRIEATYNAILQAQSDPRLNVNFGDREKVELEALKQKLQTAQQNAAYQSYEDAGNIR